VNYIESKKVIYNKHTLKREQEEDPLPVGSTLSDSQMISATFRIYVKKFDVLINPLNSGNLY
jgi:hypothetical protein